MTKLVTLIANSTDADIPTIIESLEKADIIVYENKKCIVATNTHINYLVAKDTDIENTKFIQRNRRLLYSKSLYTTNKRLIDTVVRECDGSYTSVDKIKGIK